MADTAPSPGSVGGLGAASRRPLRGLPRGSPGAGLATPAGGETVRVSEADEVDDTAVPGSSRWAPTARSCCAFSSWR
jgi:hypothetical protein